MKDWPSNLLGSSLNYESGLSLTAGAIRPLLCLHNYDNLGQTIPSFLPLTHLVTRSIGHKGYTMMMVMGEHRGVRLPLPLALFRGGLLLTYKCLSQLLAQSLSGSFQWSLDNLRSPSISQGESSHSLRNLPLISSIRVIRPQLRRSFPRWGGDRSH